MWGLLCLIIMAIETTPDVVKINEINQIKSNVVDTIHSNKDTITKVIREFKSNFDRHLAESNKELDDLNSKINEIELQIESKNTEKNDLKTLQIQHEKEILEDIKLFTDTTNDMKTELEKSQDLRQECDENPI